MRIGRVPARLVPVVAVAVAISVVTAMAVNADGQKVQRVATNNAALWVTNDQAVRYGRFNKASASMELSNRPGEETSVLGSLDVSQDGDTVVIRDLTGGRLVPVDTVIGANRTDAAIALPAEDKVDLRGGTLAVLDPASGKLWAIRTEGASRQLDLAGLDPAAPPVAELGPVAGDVAGAADLSVGADGSVHAASVSGRAVTVPVTESGFDQPVYRDLPAGLKGIQVAALGPRSAVLATETATLLLPDGRSVRLPADPKAQLQQGGADVGSVVVATSGELLTVNYEGVVTPLYSGGGGAPAAPVNLGVSAATGSCALGAWAGNPGKVARSCNGRPAEDMVMDREDPSLQDPAFRVNWGLVVLNDRETGRIFDVDLRQSLDDWKALEPAEDKTEDEKDDKTTRPTEAKPKAKDDAYGARPDRTSVLHVLDNDTDPNGRVLSIVELTEPGNGATVLVSPDGQTIQYRQPEDARDGSFQYTISNGKATATATVRVEARTDAENKPPEERLNYTVPVFAAAAAGSVTMPVASDYRDYDGDPITVVSAADGKDDVPVTADGQIEYTAPTTQDGKAQNRAVAFQLTDGNSQPVRGSAKVRVPATDDTTGIPPVAQADAVIGEVGKPITVLPLANDIPGVDPASEDTRLTLAGNVEGLKDAKITTDRDAGRVTIVSRQKGIHYLTYKAAFGSADSTEGTIRVDIREKVDDEPVAMPDQAVIRGQQAITVDVLANDSDPHGGLLTVQTARASNEDMLQVAVVKGRWLRIVPWEAELTPNPQAVSYQVINGEGKVATGSVIVTHLPPLDEDAPIVRGDTAVVRTGDSTLIPVLANDLTLGGATLSLATQVEDAPVGQLPVTDPTRASDADQGDVGTAYVAGNQVRYVAPVGVEVQKDVTVTYAARTGRRDVQGTVTVTIMPEPTEAEPDAPPEPTSIEARATSGDTITIPVPASGQDPDGDSVALVGLASGPQFGRVVATSPKGITYQAFPTEDGQGTGSFEYVVTDRYGLTGTGVVRVAVVPPGQTQVPVAVDDDLVARPGAVVQVDVIANDLIAMSDKVTVLPLVKAPDGVGLTGAQGPITATVPAAGGQPLTVDYRLSGNGGEGTSGTLTLTGVDGAANPPRLQDLVAALAEDGKTASVDVLAKAWDPDGPQSGLVLSRVSEPAATTAGGVVTIPVLPRPQVFSYEVTDADGATAAALVYVPSSGDGLPYAHGVIQLDGAKTTVALADYVTSPRGRPVRITVADSVQAAPKGRLTAKPSTSLTQVELAVEDYVGPASLTLEVTDGENLTDPDGRVAVVSIPVQVGPQTPVLRCPTEPQTVVQGTTGKAMDLVSLCHVWTADSAASAGLAFAADWQGTATPGITHTVEGQSLVLQATGDADPGARGRLVVTIPGTQAEPGVLNVLVKAARRPRYKAQSVEVRQGETVTGQISLLSPITVGRQDTIIAMPHLDGATETFSGAQWSVTADPTHYGKLAYDLTLSDVADPTSVDRQIHGTLTVAVYGIPAPPSAPTGGKKAQDRAVTLTWRTPANHGATVEKYEVRQSGGRKAGNVTPCGTNSCTIKGLDNDVPVTFQVRAWNKAGWSDWGDLSREFRPDRVPDVVTGFATSDPTDGGITLHWNRVAGEFSDVTEYIIKYEGGQTKASGAATSKVIPTRTLANEDQKFTIWAKNRTGFSRKAATAKGWPTGDPTDFEVTKVSADLDVDEPVVTLTWSGSKPNGKGPVTYTVRHGTSTVCSKETDTSCRVGRIELDGTKQSFTVEAKNFYDYTTSTSTTWAALGRPGDWASDLQLTETGNDKEFTLKTTTPNSRGRTATLRINAGGITTTRTVARTGEALNLTLEVPSNGQDHSVQLSLCNEDESQGCATKRGTVNTYGTLARPPISASVDGGTTASFSVNGINGNGREATLVVTSSRGYSRSFTVPATGSHNFGDGQDVGYSTSVTFSAHLEPRGSQKRGNSASATSNEVRTRDKPNPVANFTLGPKVGGTGRYKDWYYANLELSDWNPNSTVQCGAETTQTDLNDWSQTFNVNGSGHWGTGTTGLIVHNQNALPNTSDCRQK
jgi:hypothetical protein